VDSGKDKLSPQQYSIFKNLDVRYVDSDKSVCIQRNIGIRLARSPWIFLCDDDVELTRDYLQSLVEYVTICPAAGAVSGRWLQKEGNEWKDSYPVTSARTLLWKYIFQLGIWGEITCNSTNPAINRIKNYYKRRGNHISKAGWPVNTEFESAYTICPVYSLGASLVKKGWLELSPYDEVLDPHGIGDNYGVIIGFPTPSVHIVNKAFVYHHQEPLNRLKRSLQYYRRTFALDYFISTRPQLSHIKKRYLIWALIGNLVSFLVAGEGGLIKASLKLIAKITFNRNPYSIGSRKNKKIVEPML
jgi:glycosyltransferase involved in cell wall biosynthesis